MRLLYMPLDMIAGMALYLLAARFLARPLMPVLIVMATPAYFINIAHLMAEKPATMLGLLSLCASHWGLQYYLELAGARELDLGRGGWSEVRPGDAVVLSRVNANVLRPEKPVLADARRIQSHGRIPLRLEPLDEFTIVEVLGSSGSGRRVP